MAEQPNGKSERPRIEKGQVWVRIDGRASVRVLRGSDYEAVIHENVVTGVQGRIHSANFRRVYRLSPGLHACEGCGLELDGDDRNTRCDECQPSSLPPEKND